jgi:dihydrolipoamide dehydrogenase
VETVYKIDRASAALATTNACVKPWTVSGRALAHAAPAKILGGGIVGTHAGDMIGEIALAIEMGADAVDIGKTIHPHPTLGESIGMAAEIAHGSCTDVRPVRK